MVVEEKMEISVLTSLSILDIWYLTILILVYKVENEEKAENVN